jgi:tripartite-type tricarboxylate transporter receptor subunit TctC
MYEDTAAVLAEPPVRARLDKLGVIVVGSTPEDLATHLKSETDKWGPVIKTAGIKINE